MRITVCYHRIEGDWKAAHEHVFIPFNPMDHLAWSITAPDSLDMLEYGDASCSVEPQ